MIRGSEIPLVIVTSAVPSPGSGPPSQLRMMAWIVPVDGSVTTATGASPSRVSVSSPSAPPSTIRSSESAQSGSQGTKKTKLPPSYSSGVGVKGKENPGCPRVQRPRRARPRRHRRAGAGSPG